MKIEVTPMASASEDDDPVVHSMDVYLAKTLSDQLYLLQYPVRPANKTYSQAVYLSAKVKPEQQRVELELALNTDSPNYSRSKGEQIAINIESNSQNKTPFYRSDMMDKQVLTSIPASALKTSRYCAGFFKDGELHLTPLKGILQLHPSFEYLDRGDSKTQDKEANTGNEGEDEPKAVTVKFARRETEEAKVKLYFEIHYFPDFMLCTIFTTFSGPQDGIIPVRESEER